MRAPCNAIEIMVENIIKMRGLEKEFIELLNPILFASSLLKCQINNQLDFNLILNKKFRMN